MKWFNTYLALISLLILSACAENGDEAAHVSENENMRIISLMPSNTEIITALGFEESLVAVTTSDDYPEDLSEELLRFDTFALDEESMIALNPTHIVSHAAGHDMNLEMIDRIANSTGAEVLVVNNAQKIEEIYDTIVQVGDFIGGETEAQNLNDSLQQEVSTLEAEYSGRSTDESVLILVSTAPDIYVAGSDTFIDDFLNTLNINNTFGDVNGYPAITSEDLIAREPGKVISTIGIDSETLTGELENISGLSGHHITNPENQCTPDPNLISRPGPRVVEGLTAIAECVYE